MNRRKVAAEIRQLK